MNKVILSILIAGATIYLPASDKVAEKPTDKKSKHGSSWSYDGENNPANWGKLDKAYQMCGIGKNQSPIDIISKSNVNLPRIKFNYKFNYDENLVNMVNNGHTVQVNVADNNIIKIGNHEYTLKQFHFHTPSENHIDGKSFPLEAHFVHLDKDNNIAVIAILFEEGDINLELANLWDKMPMEKDQTIDLKDFTTKLIDLFPRNRDYFQFNGSLTTPPCSEGVKWMVIKKSVTISKGQVERFLQAVKHPNNRPIQPLNAREVLK